MTYYLAANEVIRNLYNNNSAVFSKIPELSMKSGNHFFENSERWWISGNLDGYYVCIMAGGDCSLSIAFDRKEYPRSEGEILRILRAYIKDGYVYESFLDTLRGK